MFSLAFKKWTIYVAVAVVLVGCNSIPEEQRSEVRDPYEVRNRTIFDVNVKIDDVAIEPLAKAYLASPETTQKMMTHYANWTALPSTMINSALQGDAENMSLAAVTFLVNGLTFGLADLTEDEDDAEITNFNTTLEQWGTPAGVYLVMPVVGSGTVRSHSATVVDSILNPLIYSPSTSTVVLTTQAPARLITARGNHYDLINEIKYRSLDPYARSRSIFYQHSAPESHDDLFDTFIEDSQ